VPKYVWKYARDLFGGLLQVARVSDVVAVQHGAGLMADDIHYHALWDAGAIIFLAAVRRKSWKYLPAHPER
jgi:hypothetical protein